MVPARGREAAAGWQISLPIATGEALTASRRFRGIADMGGPASLPGRIAIDTRRCTDDRTPMVTGGLSTTSRANNLTVSSIPAHSKIACS
jgi:hypothetical protein